MLPPSWLEVTLLQLACYALFIRTLVENFDVTLLERDLFPRYNTKQEKHVLGLLTVIVRYHIGESMMPSIPLYLSIIDAYELFAAQMYQYKVSSGWRCKQDPQSLTSK